MTIAVPRIIKNNAYKVSVLISGRYLTILYSYSLLNIDFQGQITPNEPIIKPNIIELQSSLNLLNRKLRNFDNVIKPVIEPKVKTDKTFKYFIRS